METDPQFFFVLISGFLLLFQVLEDEIRPRYLEALEESLNDTVHIVAAAAEDGATDRPNIQAVRRLLETARSRRFNARIYQLTKERINVNVYVTDSRGIVLYDSAGTREGQDYSSWNDVKKTLRGEYGARATRMNKDDPKTGSLYIAAPVRAGGRIVGSVTVVKANDSIQPFVRIAQRKLSQAAGFTGLLVLLLGAGVFFWITMPIRRLTEYVRAIALRKRPPFPEFGQNEIGDLARAFEQLRTELDGKAYVEQYVRTLTHEIKSPIASVRAAAEILEENPPEADRARFLANIQKETARMESLTRKLLELSSIEGRQALARRHELLVLDLFQEAARRTAGLFGESLELKIHCSPDLRLTGDRGLLESALVNLIENAADFAHKNTVISMSAERGAHSVLVRVANKGPQIPDYALSRVFERFYSIAREDGRKSTGLGLCFVREAAELHGGKASIQNTDEGVEAQIELPLRTG